MGPPLEEFKLTWLEESTPQDDLAGQARAISELRVAMFKDVPWPKAGYLQPPNAPGLGLEPDRAAIARFHVS
jgi:L-alanine-DL-glutamate epimerase-like enolase superfamily enzyme